MTLYATKTPGWISSLLRDSRNAIRWLFRTAPSNHKPSSSASSMLKLREDATQPQSQILPSIAVSNASSSSLLSTKYDNADSIVRKVTQSNTSYPSPTTGQSNINAAEYNRRFCGLLRLPIELHLMVLDELHECDKPALLSLRITCRHFLNLVPSSLIRSTHGEDLLQWSKILKYRVMCDQERQNKTTDQLPQQLVCSFCKCRHQVSMFPADQLDQEPEARTCVGIRGVFQVCQHITMTYEEVKHFREVVDQKWIFCCHKCAYLDPARFVWTRPFRSLGRIHGLIGPHQSLRGKPFHSFRPQTAIICDHTIAIVPRDPSPSRFEIIAHALETVDRHICPHVRTKDSIVVNLEPLLLTQNKENGNFVVSGVQQLEQKHRYSKCPHPDCLTRFTLFLEPLVDRTGGWFVRLAVERRIRHLDPADSTRLAQINQESTRDSRWPWTESESIAA